LLGLRVVAAHAERFVRLVIANTFLPVCDDSFFQLPGGHFYGWKSACRRSQLADDSRMNVKVLMGRNGTAGPDGPISDAEAEAYNAPFPSDEYKAGARAFPELVPTPPTDPTGERPVSLHLRGLF
jgi:haloalkane dehalogenase